MISRRHFLRLTFASAGYLVVPIKWRRAEPSVIREPHTSVIPPEKMRVLTTGDFYVQSVDKTPKISKKKWRLSCDGLIDCAREFTYEEILERPRIRRMVSFGCIGNSGGNGQIGNAWWTGCLLAPLLEELGIQTEATYVKFGCHDVYSTGLDLNELMESNALIAYEMNDRPLTRPHGFPVRIVIPGRYGMKNAKWVRSITLYPSDTGGFWEDIGWSRSAFTQLTTHIENRVVNGYLTGFALDGQSAITSIEISIDGGVTWDAADIERTDDPNIWTLWRYPLPTKGRLDVVSRAVSRDGRKQDPTDTIPFPNGSSAPDRRKMKII